MEKYHDDESEDDPDVDDIIDLLAPQLEDVVEVTLKQQSPQPARLFAAALAEADIATADIENYDVEKDGSFVVPIAVLVSWSISAHLGESTVALARHVAGILDSADVPNLMVKQLAEELGHDIVPAMIWLATGLVAEYGSSDTAWLRRYDKN